MTRKRRRPVARANERPAGPAHNLSISEILQREEDARDGWREEPIIHPTGADRPVPVEKSPRSSSALPGKTHI
jgi:hypothetical protein